MSVKFTKEECEKIINLTSEYEFREISIYSTVEKKEFKINKLI